MNSFEKKGNILDQLVVRKHVTLKVLPYIRNKYNNNNNIITQQHFINELTYGDNKNNN